MIGVVDLTALAAFVCISAQVISADVSVSTVAVYTDISVNYRNTVFSRAGLLSHTVRAGQPPGDLHL